MKVSRPIALRILAICAAALLLAGCRTIDPGSDAVCGTEVPDPTEMVVGCLVDEGGRPVPGFRVLAGTLDPNGRPGQNAIEPVDSTTTDPTGRFSFRNLDLGNFLIYANEDSSRQMPIRKVMRKAGDATARLGIDTLYRNGLLQGTLLSEDGAPLSSVACVVEGERFSTMSLGDGHFTMYLPSGHVSLLCGVDRSDLAPTRAETRVVAGDTTLLTLVIPTVEEPRPPGPVSLSLRYDDLTGIVHLSWPPVPGGVVYVLRRTDLSLGSHAYSTFFLPETSHSDVIPWIKDGDGVVRTTDKTILYNLSTAYPNKVSTLSPTMIDTVITVRPPRFLGPEVSVKLLGDKAAFLVGDTARVVGTWRNPYRKNQGLAWTLESDGTALKAVRETPDTAGTDTLVYPLTAAGKIGIRFRVVDVSGAASSALQLLEIESDP
jgi:hypothetical protein